MASVPSSTRVGEEPGDGLLTEREREIMRLVVAGKANKEIAYELGISHQTVKNYMSNIMWRLDVANRTQAAVQWIRSGRA